MGSLMVWRICLCLTDVWMGDVHRGDMWSLLLLVSLWRSFCVLLEDITREVDGLCVCVSGWSDAGFVSDPLPGE